MNRRTFLGALTGLLGAPLAVEAQQAGKVYRVGILTNKASDPAEARLWQAFRSGLRERGWIEGQNILIEFRAAEGNTARLPDLAADLVRLKVDLIVARASIWVQPAKEATSSIPIVFLNHADPVGTGHVASLARPGGNITGLAVLMTDLAPKSNSWSADPPGYAAGYPNSHIHGPTKNRHTIRRMTLQKAARRSSA